MKDNPTSVQFGEHLTRKQAALFLNVTESALVRWQRERRGPKVIKYGRIVRYRLKDLQDFLDSVTIHTVNDKSSVTLLTGASSPHGPREIGTANDGSVKSLPDHCEPPEVFD